MTSSSKNALATVRLGLESQIDDWEIDPELDPRSPRSRSPSVYNCSEARTTASHASQAAQRWTNPSSKHCSFFASLCSSSPGSSGLRFRSSP
eukprot:CAMPEP_0114245680 /NCGR_PEP_ID=MMETSP0058-20121206/12037_1 /TAXON_ID=36894 /ORGANISM="Pyramimonas parkeae, CCMP726" /LENGTH=91 /DNA_ID=CAMNT_0001358773 /DNA_START=232 /DNA_END=507 /DNA_ORIENTATION=-